MIVLFILALVGTLYLAFACVRVAWFGAQPVELASEFLPSITILKPVAGLEPGLYENLASFCDQDYPDFDVVFCLHGPDDPALETVRRIVDERSGLRASIAVGNDAAMLNPKIANLAKPGVELRGEIVVIADSDICVDKRYLLALASSFATQRVGAATCLYAAMPNASLASLLGALHVEDDFAPSVLVATAIGKLRFCLGATMAVRRSVLAEIGGIEALGSHVADDHELGASVAARGYDVALSRYVVKTVISETTLRALWSHELRWARTNLAMAPVGYFFSFVMYALPLAIVYLAASWNLVVGLPLVAVVLLLRLCLHSLARAALGVDPRRDAWLIPPRDFLSLALWLASLFGRTVRWRSETHRI
jgi:ceramide glucosyltransferase